LREKSKFCHLSSLDRNRSCIQSLVLQVQEILPDFGENVMGNDKRVVPTGIEPVSKGLSRQVGIFYLLNEMVVPRVENSNLLLRDLQPLLGFRVKLTNKKLGVFEVYLQAFR
jgi:hypothetical protein